MAVLASAVAVDLVGGRARGTGLPTRGRSDPGARAVADYERAFAAKFAACPNKECLVAAHARCERSHLYRACWTIEGTPAFMDLFVVRNGPRRVVVEFADFSRDYWAVAGRLEPTTQLGSARSSERRTLRSIRPS